MWLLFVLPFDRKLFFGVNEIAVKVPSVFKLLIKEVWPSYSSYFTHSVTFL